MRRLAAAAAAAAALAVPAVAAAPRHAGSRPDASRALASYAAMQRYLFDSRTGTYREQVGSRARAHVWPLSQAIAAAIGVTALRASYARDVKARLGRLGDFRAGPLYTASVDGDVYYDDNEWIAEDLLDVGATARAAAVFGAVVEAWDDDPAKPCSGGIQWTAAAGNDDRNTVTTANGAVVGLRLYALTKRPVFLDWSQRMLEWLDRCMLAPNGLYWDHIGADGAVDTTHWTYNQGSVLGAELLLFRATRSAAALARAEALADATLAYFQGARLASEPPEFAAIFFRNLLSLAAAAHRSDYVAAVRTYADAAWARHRSARTGLFSFGGPTRLLDQSALVQIYAALAATADR